MIVGGIRPSANVFTSWFGRVRMMAFGQKWPTFAGEPMLPLCQINCDELPFRPPAFTDITFITAFVAPDALPYRMAPSGEGWELRTYKIGQPLLPLDESVLPIPSIKPFPIQWQFIREDFPSWEEAIEVLRLDQDQLALYEEHTDLFQTHYCSKIGGWPSLLQGELFAGYSKQPNYVFQIDSESKAHWGWGDTGIGYFGYQTLTDSQHWVLDCQQL